MLKGNLVKEYADQLIFMFKGSNKFEKAMAVQSCGWVIYNSITHKNKTKISGEKMIQDSMNIIIQ